MLIDTQRRIEAALAGKIPTCPAEATLGGTRMVCLRPPHDDDRHTYAAAEAAA